MIRIIENDKIKQSEFIKELRSRNEETNEKAEAAVREIIKNVREKGDEALFYYSEEFDKVKLNSLEIQRKIIDDAFEKADKKFVCILEKAAKNIREFHENQRRQSFVITKDGSVTGQRVRPLKRVGIYVPGGTAAYPSSVLMNAIPAKVAGVEEIIMVTPPDKNGLVNPDILAAALVAGVDRIFTVGGAQAIAALSYGTESIPKVDKITGPGNIYVATAKRLLYGTVDIDMIAGPSEILIIADETADPKFLAADLLSQAEHDKLAASVLLTTDENIAKQTAKELSFQLSKLKRKEIAQSSIDNFGVIIICESLDICCQMADEIAPEHLEIMTAAPFDLLGKIQNAGSVFLGKYAPEPLGDYFAGANHVLPTSGTARFFSPLSTDDFVKKSSYIYYNKEALEKVHGDIEYFAEKEGLTAHKNSLSVRFEG